MKIYVNIEIFQHLFNVNLSKVQDVRDSREIKLFGKKLKRCDFAEFELMKVQHSVSIKDK